MKKSNSTPLVSVIIPVYNSEKFLQECISSILEQTYQNIDVIFVNDGSTDKSLDILKTITDNRVKVLTKKNSGASEARNTGLKEAKGDYVCFVDSDDIIDSRYIETLLDVTQRTSADITCTSYICFTDTLPTPANSASTFKHLTSREAIKQLLTERISSAPHGKLFKHKVIKNISFPRLTISEDLLFNYQAIKQAKVITTSNLALYYYRQNAQSLTKRKFMAARMDGIVATQQIIESEGASVPSIIRAFMEAHYILESMNNQKGLSKYKKQCFNIIRNYRFPVLFSKEARAKQRIFAILSVFSPALPSKIVRLKRRH